VIKLIPDFGDILVEWWNQNGRSFPWRNTEDPFKIFVAEVLLHRTRAYSVVPVYLELINNFSTMHDLSQVDEKTLQRMLASLGLKWRTRMLHETSRIIDINYGGIIPIEKDKLLSLPGIGAYIASAVRVFTVGSDDPLIDTNTVRVISRFRGWKQDDKIRRTEKVRNSYSHLRGKQNPKYYGYAMIDLAYTICLPRTPNCVRCPISKNCKTGKSNLS
jgi:A/G-specific adenine glycosylase